MKKKLTVLVALLLLVTVSVGGTLAWLATQTAPVTNTFTPSHVTTAVDEKTEGGVKSDVKIQNTGDTSAYIRATYVVNWVDANGNIYAAQPVEDIDYTILLNVGFESAPWTKGTDDGYYYCNTAIDPGSDHQHRTSRRRPHRLHSSGDHYCRGHPVHWHGRSRRTGCLCQGSGIRRWT